MGTLFLIVDYFESSLVHIVDEGTLGGIAQWDHSFKSSKRSI
jgi:hypothetical protein